MGSNKRLLAVVIVLSLALEACGWLRGLGRSESSLAGRGIKQIDIRLADKEALCPGFPTQLNVLAISHEGDTHSTLGKASWGNFDISMRGGVVSPRGRVQLSGDPRVSSTKGFEIEAVLVHNPTVRKTLRFMPRYDCDYRAHFRDRRGKGLSVKGTLDMKGDVARLILNATDSSRAGMFYMTGKSTVEIDVSGRAASPRGPAGDGGTVSIEVDPSAAAFRDRIKAITRGGPGKPPGKDGEPLRFLEKTLYLP
jgi:hypothetical protein